MTHEWKAGDRAMVVVHDVRGDGKVVIRDSGASWLQGSALHPLPASAEDAAWQPMGTAPTDGEELDLFANGRRIPDCHWHAGEWLCWASSSVDEEPTWKAVKRPVYWMRVRSPGESRRSPTPAEAVKDAETWEPRVGERVQVVRDTSIYYGDVAKISEIMPSGALNVTFERGYTCTRPRDWFVLCDTAEPAPASPDIAAMKEAVVEAARASRVARDAYTAAVFGSPIRDIARDMTNTTAHALDDALDALSSALTPKPENPLEELAQAGRHLMRVLDGESVVDDGEARVRMRNAIMGAERHIAALRASATQKGEG
jgi:hypothetical protein